MGWRSGQAYSDDLRARILAAVAGGLGAYEVAELFGVSVSYVYKALERCQRTGIETALPSRGRPGRKLEKHAAALAAHVAAHPDATLLELVEWARRELGVTVCVATMWGMLEALGLTLKKRHVTRPSRSARMLPPPAPHGAAHRPS
jgi:transposase